MLNSSTPAISIQGVRVSFEERTLLSDFDLELRNGEKVTLAGRSGSGKTTLLRALLGFYTPALGELSVAGLPVDAAHVATVRQRISWLPQQAEPGADTVREALCLPLEFKNNHANEGHFTEQHMQQALQQVGLEALDLGSEASRLSGGEKQRLAIARALLLDRPIWLVDEPTSSLDAETKAMVMHCILNSPERTVLAISHDDEFLARFDRVVHVGKQVDHE
jgi:ABC-type transport system involved in cytochrome bd biosynthesis fused ATPase/permease subunit